MTISVTNPLPKHLRAAYDWTAAAGELDELAGHRGRRIITYARESEANARENDVTDVHASDIKELAEWLRSSKALAQPASTKRHHATKKSSAARLDRDVHRALVLSLKPGAKVVANGYPGSVVRVTPYNMIEVRLPGGVAAVSAEDVTIPGVSQGNYP